MSQIEDKIIDIFNQQSAGFPDSIPQDDARLQAILKHFSPLKNKVILDAGCGKGRFLEALETHGAQPAGVEPAQALLAVAQKQFPHLTLKEASVTKLPFPDNHFDGVMCIEVLEHIPDYPSAIQEMHRVLKPGGKLVIIDKSSRGLSEEIPVPSIWLKKWREHHNKWMYPASFPFKEIWFHPTGLKRVLEKQQFTHCGVDYMHMHRRFWHIFPQTAYFALWYGTKA